MKFSTQFRGGPIRLIFFVIAAATSLPGCGGEEVTARSLKDARAKWTKADIRDYDVEWESSGPSQSHYVVEVRKGEVRKVQGVGLDGKRFPLKPAETRLYGIDGLFTIVADELAILDTETPFGKPKGTKAVLRFTTDPTSGYLKTYRRDVMGAPQALAIDVLRFDRVAPAGEPSATKGA